MRRVCLMLVGVTLLPAIATAQLPDEPLVIERSTPQFVLDSALVDNHWAIRYKRQAVTLVSHAPVKYPASPFAELTSDLPSFVTVVRDADVEQPLFRMYYQANHRVSQDAEETGPSFRTDVAYAESSDGLHWTKPDLQLFPEKSYAQPNNIVIGWKGEPQRESNGPLILEGLPDHDRRGYKYVLSYRASGRGQRAAAGIHVIGTHDGVHFDSEHDQHIAHLHSDAHNAICYDPHAERYVLFCRAKQMYRSFGEEMIDTGASRRVAVMTSPELWSDWLSQDRPRTLLVPDARDAQTHHNFFYGMPAVHRYGLYGGFLQVFRMNDFIHTELVTSRDGEHWQRHPQRPPLLPFGDEGTWDDTMIFVSPCWVEVDHEWWFYYTGWDGPHGTSERTGSVGLATCPRERLLSLRGPAGGGVVCTRTLVWPGGDLWLNAAPVDEAADVVAMSVRVSDVNRRPREGFDHTDAHVAASGDLTRRIVCWGDNRSLDSLAGETIRLEFFLQNVDLFTFGSTPQHPARENDQQEG